MPTELESYYRNFIGGRWLDAESEQRLDIEDPATGAKIAEVALASAVDVDRAVSAARRAADSRLLVDMRPRDRARLLRDVASELRLLGAEITAAECLDNGKRLSDASLEADSAADYFDYYAGATDKLEGRYIPLGGDYIDYTIPTPYGVSAHIVPWNYPIGIAARSVPAAIAAGNTVVVKAPELSPVSVLLLARAAERAGLPAGVLNVITGLGHLAGAALTAHDGVDHIVFTGSLRTGRSILRAAAERIVPAVVELGGKSAAIVFEDADLESALEQVCAGIFVNAGQICSAASRLLVHRSRHRLAVEWLIEWTKKLSVGPGREDHDITPLISAQQLRQVESACDRAVSEGARCIAGGRRAPGLAGHFFQPTVFDRVQADMRIAREEVFGPVLVVLAFDTEDEALVLANGTDYGLAAGVFTRDLNTAHRMAARLVAGQVYVNEWFAGGIETPFGGFRRSGFGREKGLEGLAGYQQSKNVAVRLVDTSPARRDR